MQIGLKSHFFLGDVGTWETPCFVSLQPCAPFIPMNVAYWKYTPKSLPHACITTVLHFVLQHILCRNRWGTEAAAAVLLTCYTYCAHTTH